MCLTRLIKNQQNAGIDESNIPNSYVEEVDDDEFIQEEDYQHQGQDEGQIMFVGISTYQIQLDDGYNPLTVLDLCTSINNDLSAKRYEIEPTPTFTPSTIASLFEVGLKEIYEGYNHTYPEHVIIYRNVVEESELGHLKADHGEIHEIKSVIKGFYGDREVKFSYVAVVTNYSGIGLENVEIVPNGTFILNPIDQQQGYQYMLSNSNLAPRTNTCLTLGTSSPNYDLNELVRLTEWICEFSGLETKPTILKTTTRFTNTIGQLLLFRTLQERQAQEQAEQGNN